MVLTGLLLEVAVRVVRGVHLAPKLAVLCAAVRTQCVNNSTPTATFRNWNQIFIFQFPEPCSSRPRNGLPFATHRTSCRARVDFPTLGFAAITDIPQRARDFQRVKHPSPQTSGNPSRHGPESEGRTAVRPKNAWKAGMGEFHQLGGGVSTGEGRQAGS
jgi:hypothetical protein